MGIVVLNFNGEDCLTSCLRSLETLTYPHFFVVVVDNASNDSSFKQAQKIFPQHLFLRNETNRGFAGGMNDGLALAFGRGADFVWLFNNDATTTPEALTALVEVALRSSSIGLLSPLIFGDPSSTPWFAQGKIDFFRMRASHVVPYLKEQKRLYYESQFLTGCALLISRAVFEAIGLLDERFFLYYEDADYSLRARKKGFQVVVVPKAHVMHAEQSKKQEGKLYYLVLSGLLFFEKQGSFWQKPYFLVYGTIRRMKNILDRIRGRAGARAVYRAYQKFYHDA